MDAFFGVLGCRRRVCARGCDKSSPTDDRPAQIIGRAEFQLSLVRLPSAVVTVSIGGPTLQCFDEFGEPGIRLVCVDYAMIDCKRNVGHRTNLDRVRTSHFSDDDPFFQFADAKDRRLRLRDYNWRCEQRTGNAVVRDRKRTSTNVGSSQTI